MKLDGVVIKIVKAGFKNKTTAIVHSKIISIDNTVLFKTLQASIN